MDYENNYEEKLSDVREDLISRISPLYVVYDDLKNSFNTLSDESKKEALERKREDVELLERINALRIKVSKNEEETTNANEELDKKLREVEEAEKQNAENIGSTHDDFDKKSNETSKELENTTKKETGSSFTNYVVGMITAFKTTIETAQQLGATGSLIISSIVGSRVWGAVTDIFSKVKDVVTGTVGVINNVFNFASTILSFGSSTLKKILNVSFWIMLIGGAFYYFWERIKIGLVNLWEQKIKPKITAWWTGLKNSLIEWFEKDNNLKSVVELFMSITGFVAGPLGGFAVTVALLFDVVGAMSKVIADFANLPLKSKNVALDAYDKTEQVFKHKDNVTFSAPGLDVGLPTKTEVQNSINNYIKMSSMDKANAAYNVSGSANTTGYETNKKEVPNIGFQEVSIARTNPEFSNATATPVGKESKVIGVEHIVNPFSIYTPTDQTLTKPQNTKAVGDETTGAAPFTTSPPQGSAKKISVNKTNGTVIVNNAFPSALAEGTSVLTFA